MIESNDLETNADLDREAMVKIVGGASKRGGYPGSYSFIPPSTGGGGGRPGFTTTETLPGTDTSWIPFYSHAFSYGVSDIP